MADFYTAKQLNDIMSSHAQCVQALAGASQQMGSLSVRGVQLWAQAAAIDPATASAAGTAFAASAAAQWASNKVHLAAALDGVAASTGSTRQQLLNELAAMPQTSFS